MNRKFTALCLACAMLAPISAMPVSAEVCDVSVSSGAWNFESIKTYGDFEYDISDEGSIVIVGYIGASGKAEIPSKIKGKTVTSISHRAFYNCSQLTEITIPDTVTKIGVDAFLNCSSLKKINIPASVEYFGSMDMVSASRGYNIYDVAVEGGTYQTDLIAFNVFKGCSSLTEINVDSANKNFKSVDGVLFTNDMSTLITYPGGKTGAYTVPSGAKIMCIEAFSSNPHLTEVKFSEGFEKIETKAFLNCTGLKTVELPKSLTGIGYDAFRGCTALESIDIPRNLSELDNGAFTDCTGLKAVNVDSANSNFVSVDGVVYDKNITSLLIYPKSKPGTYAIPETVTSLKTNFANCKGLTGVFIPKNLTSLYQTCFSNCENLKFIRVDPNNSSLTSVNGVVFSKDLSELRFYPTGRKGTYVVPNTTKKIASGSFLYAQGITDLVVPDSVTEIAGENTDLQGYTSALGWYAFEGAGNLKIKANPGSYAESYAGVNNIPFSNITPEDLKEPVKFGDIDGDGKITSSDSLSTLRYSVGLEKFSEEVENAADVNLDGEIDSADSLALLRSSVGFVDTNTFVD